MTTAFIASPQPPNPKMPSNTEPAAAALPILEPLAQQVELLKAVVASKRKLREKFSFRDFLNLSLQIYRPNPD